MNSQHTVAEASHDTVTFLGLTLQPRSLDELNSLVEQGVREQQRWIIANHNLHSLYLYHRHPRLRDFYAKVRWTHIDGMSIVMLARLYGYRLHAAQRVTLVDWTYPLMALAAAKGWRVFHLGSSRAAAETGAARLRAMFPNLQLEVSEGYFDARYDSPENEALIAKINASPARPADGGYGDAAPGILDAGKLCQAECACDSVIDRGGS